MSFGKWLTAARKRKGLTQEQLGKGLAAHGEDASKSVVYGWEKDQHFPKVDQLVLICERLGCSADYLLFGRESASGLSPEVAELASAIEAIKDEDARGVALEGLRTAVRAGQIVAAANQRSLSQPPNDGYIEDSQQEVNGIRKG